MNLVLGTRGSPLALAQAQLVIDRLKRRDASLQIQTKIIKTQGDQIVDVPLWKIGDKGLFIKELETALRQKEIDLAVHSVKDLPAVLPDDLKLTYVLEREDPSDVLISREKVEWENLPRGAVVGTSALRRQSQILNLRPDLRVTLLRGNVDTRLRKLDQGDYDAILVARAGLNRLGIHRGQTLSSRLILPSPGQGALAIQTRAGALDCTRLAETLRHAPTALCVRAEREFLLRMEGGCQLPLGGLARLEGDGMVLDGFLGSPDGREVVRAQGKGESSHPEALGANLALQMLQKGEKILTRLAGSAGNPGIPVE